MRKKERKISIIRKKKRGKGEKGQVGEGKRKGKSRGRRKRRRGERILLKIGFVRLDSIKYSNFYVFEKFDYWDRPVINGAKKLKFLYKTASTNTN